MARSASTRVMTLAMSMIVGGLALAGCSGVVSTPPASEQPDTPTVSSATATPEPLAGAETATPSPQRPPLGTGITDSAAIDDSFRRRSQFVPLDNPEFIPAAQASFLTPDDRILGLTYLGESRAYPLRMMTYHHIANDTIGGKPFLVTF